MKDECYLGCWPMEEKDPRYTQGKDYALDSNRPCVGPPAEVDAMNSTTTEKIAETGLIIRQPL